MIHLFFEIDELLVECDLLVIHLFGHNWQWDYIRHGGDQIVKGRLALGHECFKLVSAEQATLEGVHLFSSLVGSGGQLLLQLLRLIGDTGQVPLEYFHLFGTQFLHQLELVHVKARLCHGHFLALLNLLLDVTGPLLQLAKALGELLCLLLCGSQALQD